MIISYSPNTLARAADLIARGGVVAFRTDTFYGLGADPFNQAAVSKIKELKGREENKPILIVVGDYDDVPRFVESMTSAFELLAKKFWPGPLTLIGLARRELPEEITCGTKTVGVRLPGDDRVRALVRSCGGALTSTSANPSHEAAATSARQVEEYFGDSLDAIIDDGAARTHRPSTVVDASQDEPKLIREGVIPWARIADGLSKVDRIR